jgi:hypothetical protein
MRKSIVTVLGPTSPVHDLTTVEAVNAALGLVSNTANDGITAEQITNISRMIADICNAGVDRMRTFGLLTLEENFRVVWGEPVHALYLRQFPIEQITSITQGGNETDATMYELDDEAGLLWMKCGHWCGEVVANYSGGYDLPDEAPALLAQACIEALRAQRANAGRNPGVRDVQHGDTRVSFNDYYNRFGLAGSGGTSIFPPNVTDMIEHYKRRTV